MTGGNRRCLVRRSDFESADFDQILNEKWRHDSSSIRAKLKPTIVNLEVMVLYYGIHRCVLELGLLVSLQYPSVRWFVAFDGRSVHPS